MTPEEAGVEIVRTISAPGYSHAENIFLLLRQLEDEGHSPDEAVLLVHDHVMNQP